MAEPTIVATDTFGTVSGGNATAFSGLTDTAVIPAGAQAGDLALLLVGTTDPAMNATVSTPGGAWTQLNRQVLNSSQGSVWARELTSGDVGAAVSSTTYSGTRTWGVIIIVRGHNGLANVTIASAGQNSSPAPTTLIAPAVTFSTTGDHLILHGAFDKGAAPSGTWTAPAGVTNQVISTATPSGAGSSVWARRNGAVTSSPSGTSSWTKAAYYQAGMWTLAIPAGSTPPPAPGTVSHINAAAKSATSFAVKGLTAGFTDGDLLVSTSSDLSSPTAFQGTVDADGYFKATATGLTQGTLYYYGIADTPSGGTRTVVSEVGEVRTHRTGTTSYSWAVSSCFSNNATDAVGLAEIAADASIDFYVSLGDDGYPNPTTGDVATHRGYRNTAISNVTGFKNLLRRKAYYYEMSDHDNGPGDNLDSTGVETVGAIAAYMQMMACAELVEDVRVPVRGRYQSFVSAGVRHILLDHRTLDRSPGLQSQGPTKTAWGATQEAWLADLFETRYDLNVVYLDVPWQGPASNDANMETNAQDKMWAYADSRAWFIALVAGHNVAMVNGDTHSLGYTARNSNAYGDFPVFSCSPIGNIDGGRYLTEFDARYPNPTTGTVRRSQYGKFTVTRTGSTIALGFVGRDATNATDRLTYTETWDLGVTGTGSLAAQPAALSGAATQRAVGSGSLVAPAATLSGQGAQRSVGASGLVAQPATLSGAAAQRQVGTSALVAQPATLSGAATQRAVGAGSLVAPAATLSGQGTQRAVGAGSLVSQPAQLSGQAAGGANPGTGALVAPAATLAGQATQRAVGSGSLVTRPATLAGQGSQRALGTGGLVAQPGTLFGIGTNEPAGPELPPTLHDGVAILIPSPARSSTLQSAGRGIVALTSAPRPTATAGGKVVALSSVAAVALRTADIEETADASAILAPVPTATAVLTTQGG